MTGCSSGPGGPGAGMLAIGAGSFWMGCNQEVDSACFSFEYPYHQVTLDSYEIDATEVTQAQYAECVEAAVCPVPSCEWDPDGHARYPVVCLTWYAAADYCEFQSKRLCSEAEWERAARGTDGNVYPWGNQPASCSLAVINDGGSGCGTNSFDEVGSRSAGDSPCGAKDMCGNVLEWVADWFGQDYYDLSPPNNPQGPDSGTARVMRGGSYNASATTARSSYRAQADPDMGYYDLGFRCCN
jgi:eukaryotic-like serine/threonine-protein kinase